MLKINHFAWLALCLPLAAAAQIHDDFTDHDLTQNPSWQGNLTHFQTDAAAELQLNAPAAGQSSLVVAGNILDSAVWTLVFRLEFAPSAGNRLRIYLQTDGPTLASANGYFLEIGENGTADALRFYRQNGGTTFLLGTGQAATLANDPAMARLKIVRKTGGFWKIGADFTGGDNFQPQIEATDATWKGSANSFFGFDCLFSATRKDKFFFDDLDIQPDLPDQTPPKLLHAEPLDETHVVAVFDEKLDVTKASDPTHFFLNQGIGQPILAEILTSKSVKLTVAQPFLDGKTYQLTTVGLTDEFGNQATVSQTADFFFVKISPPAPFEILINEIMADPSPSVGLPDAEWVELLNRSTKTIDLQAVTFSAGGSPIQLPSYFLKPDSLVLLVSAANAASFFSIKNKIALPNFPALSNSADELSLADTTGQLLDFVSYDLSFYHDDSKNDGGWSLERINPLAPCAGGENWAACATLPGGTPALPNSVLMEKMDAAPPDLLDAFPLGPLEIRLRFSEGLDAATATNFQNFEIEPPLQISSAELSADRRTVVLKLDEAMQTGVIYRLKIGAAVSDCAGNLISQKDTARVALPELAEANDLIINELLFNPATGGSDFVEFFNRSKKVLSLADLFVGNFQTTSTAVEKITVERLIFPNEFAVLTASPTDILTRFEVKNPSWLHENALPSFADDAGNVRIYRENGPSGIVILDDFDYSKNLHHVFLTDAEKEGRSLERLAADRPTNDATNWQTAAQAAGNATPTARNSQSAVAQLVDNEWLTLSARRVSPDGDGFEDFILMDLNLPSAGFTGHIVVFSETGALAKTVAAQQLVGPQPRFRWDGDLTDGSPAPIGIYILQAEFLSADGRVLRKKVPIAVVKRF